MIDHFLQQFIIGALLTLSVCLMIIFFNGVFGGVREVEPTAEDEILVNYIKKTYGVK